MKKYKILSKSEFLRFDTWTERFSQSGFIPGRDLSEIWRRVFDSFKEGDVYGSYVRGMTHFTKLGTYLNEEV
jgi:hypothetical protein